MTVVQQWIAFITIVSRECRRMFRVWRQSFLPPAITSILYFIIFGQVVGQRIGEMDGFSYIQYIAPGLIMMQIITSAYTSSVFAFYIAKMQRQIQELQVSPMPPHIIVLGFTASGVLRGVITGLIVMTIALFFTHLHLHSVWIIAGVVLCSACLFALAGLVNAVYAKTFDDISIIPTFVLAPLTYLGGVFYSISLLPPFWQTISLINPIAYIVNAFRFGVLGVADASIVIGFGVMAAFILFLFVFAYSLIKSGRGLRE